MDSLHLNSKRQRSSGVDEVDYINCLPDDLLIQILDKIPIDEARGTVLISKRWSGLWMLKKRIEIGGQWVRNTGLAILPSLIKLWDAYPNNRVESISLSFHYDRSMAMDVLSFLGSADLRNVEELYVDFDDENIRRENRRRRYPRILIGNPNQQPQSSLVKQLSLRALRLEAFPCLRFKALEQLFLDQVKFRDYLVEQVTENCPLLTLLRLKNCNPTSDLKIITSVDSKLLHLVVEEEFGMVGSTTSIYINCPSLKSVYFLLALPRKGYHIEGTLDCSDSVTFKLDKMYQSPQAMRIYALGITGNCVRNFVELIRKLKTSEVLTLSSWCIQVLSIEAVRLCSPPSFDATHVVLRTGLKRWELFGISYMLSGCSKIKSLVIIMTIPAEMNFKSLEGRHFLDEKPYRNVLKGLSVVEFRNYNGDYTWEGNNFNVATFFSGFEYGEMLWWSLKLYAKNLEKFVFTTKRQVHQSDEIRFRNSGLHRLHKYRIMRTSSRRRRLLIGGRSRLRRSSSL